MNRLILFSLSLLIFVLIVLPLLSTFAIKVIPGGIQPPLGNTVKIYDSYTYLQSFIPPENNLTGIGVSIKNPNFANKKKLAINLYDDNGKLIREVSLNGQNIADGKFVKILFEPIFYSKGKKFTWSVSSGESLYTDALEIFITDKKPSWSLDLRENDKELKDSFSYVTLHRPTSSTAVLKEAINAWVDKIKGDSIFFILYGLIIIALFIGIVSKFLPKNLKRFS